MFLSLQNNCLEYEAYFEDLLLTKRKKIKTIYMN